MTKREWLLTMLPQMLNGKNEDGRLARGIANPLSLTHRALLNPDMGGDPVGQLSSKNYWRLELPWANGIASARGLERIYAVLACGGELDGKRLLSQQTLAAVYPCRSWDYDQVLRKELGFSYGFLKEGRGVFSPNAETFGHAGLGGSMGMADPVTSMAFAYVMNRMDHRLRSPRCLALCVAVYQCL
jgi:CubicO group peptidase (beta-lactamase class C family)